MTALHTTCEYGNGAVNHSRMRMGLSGHNAQKKYNFMQNGAWPHCNLKQKKMWIVHVLDFLLICPAFAAPRKEMLDALEMEIPDTVNVYE